MKAYSLNTFLLLIIGSIFFSACERSTKLSTPPIESRVVVSTEVQISLTERIEAFDADVSAGEIGELVNYMPPRLIDSFLTENGLTKTELSLELEKAWDDLLDVAVVESYRFDAEARQVEALPSGEIYKVLPTYMTMSMKNNPDEIIQSYSETLVISDKDDWHFVRLDSEQAISRFRRLYPEYAVIKVSPQKLERRPRRRGE